jgi:glycogen debranching enzyme
MSTDTSERTRQDRLSGAQAQRKEAILTQSAPSKLGGTKGATVLKQAELYLLTNDAGDVPWDLPHAFGLYAYDCRFLNGLLVRINGSELEVLSSSHIGDDRSIHHLTNPGMPRLAGAGSLTPHTVSVQRSHAIRGGAVHESIRIRNHNLHPVRVAVDLRARCAFEDLFAVKGFVDPPHGEIDGPAAVSACELNWTYHGRDGNIRRTHIALNPVPAWLSGDCASFEITLEPGTESSIAVVITPSLETAERTASVPRRRASDESHTRRGEQLWLQSSAHIVSSHEVLDAALRRALLDLKLSAAMRPALHCRRSPMDRRWRVRRWRFCPSTKQQRRTPIATLSQVKSCTNCVGASSRTWPRSPRAPRITEPWTPRCCM